MDINDEILDLWESTNNEYTSLAPYIYPELIEKNVLFLGINPSDSNKRGDLTSIQNNINTKDYDKKILISHEKKMLEQYSYFKPIRDNLDEGLWTHGDIFLVRDKFQHKLINSLLEDDDLIDFFDAQIKILKKVIMKINPKLIIIANAFASKLFEKDSENKKIIKIRKRLRSLKDISINHDDYHNVGYSILEIDNHTFRVLQAGILTGSRALDVGSRNLLFWNIKRIINK